MGLIQTDVKDLKKLKANKKSAKPTKIPSKKGINLARREDEKNKQKQIVLLAALALVALLALLKFGVLDLYAELREAEAAYNDTHLQSIQIDAALENYDAVRLEYRTYSMDWLENDDNGRLVSVSRREILDLVESQIMTKGEVSSISISGDNLTVQMTGLNLKQVSELCTKLEETDFVASAIVSSAATDGGETGDEAESISGSLAFAIQITIQKPAKEAE